MILFDSGTHALQAALADARRSGSKIVALPAYCCYDIATAAVGAGVRISLYDVNADSLSPDLDSLERVLADGASTVVVAPLYGVVIEWELITALADRYGGSIIEDAAQGHGATWRGCPLGSLGKTSILSFGRGKGWTGGSGGAILTRHGGGVNPEKSVSSGVSSEMVSFARVAAQWALGRPELYGIPHAVPGLKLGETVYKVPSLPNGISRVAARTLCASHNSARTEAAIRKRNAAVLLSAICEVPRISALLSSDDGEQGFLRMPVRMANGIAGFRSQRNAIRSGIAPGYPKPLYSVREVAERLSGPESKWPGADSLAHELVTLPVHSRLTPEDLIEIAHILRSCNDSSGSLGVV